jgi:hypothetical protein
MRYTAIAAILFGIVVACYAGFHYASGGPPGRAEKPSTASLAVPLAFAACLVIGGVAMWVYAGRGFTASQGSPVGTRAERAEARKAARTKPDQPRG